MGASFAIRWDPAEFWRKMAKVNQDVADVLQEMANITVEYAKESPPSPYLTGTNRKSIGAEFTAKSGVKRFGESPPTGDSERTPTGNDVGFRVFATSGYGGYLEIGTSKMAARPYIKPAFDRAMAEAHSRLEGMLK